MDEVTYEFSGIYTLVNPEHYEKHDGKKYFYDVVLEDIKKTETGRTVSNPIRTNVTIEY